MRCLRWNFIRSFKVVETSFDNFYLNFWRKMAPWSFHRKIRLYDDGIDTSRPQLKLIAFAAFIAGIVTEKQQLCTCQDDEGTRLTPKDLEPLLSPSPSNPIPVTHPPPMPGLGGESAKSRTIAPVFGLPYRGKVFVARELQRYVEFFHGSRVRVFDISNYLGHAGDKMLYRDLVEFFEGDAHSDNDDDDISNSCRYHGGFAIITAHDTVESTSSVWSAHTKYNRCWMLKELRDRLKADIWFIQITVDDNKEAVNYMAKLSRKRGKTLEESKTMIDNYMDHYVPIQMDGSENSTPFIQLINYTEAMIVNQVMQTYLGSRICHFLANLHPYPHTVFLSRDGESEYTVQGRLGGDSSLTPSGREYARRLGEFSQFVVSGKATNMVCVTLTPAEVERLPERLTRLPFQHSDEKGLYARGDWDHFGDGSGATVLDSMRLVRLQRAFGEDFVDAPVVLDEMLAMIRGRAPTLVFVSGRTMEAGTIPARLWTSSLVRAIETAEFVPHAIIPGPGNKPWKQMRERVYRSLDEIYAGSYDGKRGQDIAVEDPHILTDRRQDKLGFRFPRGESYYDVIARLDDLLTNLERIREPILIISHQHTVRLIFGWLTELSRKDSLQATIAPHTVVKISFDGLEDRTVTICPLGPTREAMN